jgi:diadenosine tetraphosphatase ApaH/serine/threonine PP2A family protein phosphatase
MKIAVVSDIHANLIDLQRVFVEIQKKAADAIWCLGDTVGYGPYPQECVDIIRSQAQICLAGNHDLAVLGKIDLAAFNLIAREAILWQRKHLTDESLAWLQNLPSRVETAVATLAHASPRHPIWEYIDNEEVAAENYDAFNTPIGLIGHSHLAMGWQMQRKTTQIETEHIAETPGTPITLNLVYKWLLNPGSVGQPRDHDPRASFAMLDTEAWTWTWHRVEYDIERVEQDIMAAGLPEVLGRRLHLGW